MPELASQVARATRRCYQVALSGGHISTTASSSVTVVNGLTMDNMAYEKIIEVCRFHVLQSHPMSIQLSSFTPTQLRHAADLKEKIGALRNELSTLLGAPAPVSSVIVPKKAGMSAAGRAKIAAAQKARWAKIKAPTPAVQAPAKKRTMSAEGRAKVASAQKARWAKVKGAKG